jgi:hypothetical protein
MAGIPRPACPDETLRMLLNVWRVSVPQVHPDSEPTGGGVPPRRLQKEASRNLRPGGRRLPPAGKTIGDPPDCRASRRISAGAEGQRQDPQRRIDTLLNVGRLISEPHSPVKDSQSSCPPAGSFLPRLRTEAERSGTAARHRWSGRGIMPAGSCPSPLQPGARILSSRTAHPEVEPHATPQQSKRISPRHDRRTDRVQQSTHGKEAREILECTVNISSRQSHLPFNLLQEPNLATCYPAMSSVVARARS